LISGAVDDQSQTAPTRPRVVYVGKEGFWDQLGDVPNEHAVVSRHLDATAITLGPRTRLPAGSVAVTLPRLRPRLLGGALFYAIAPVLALVLARRRGAAIVTKSPFEAIVVAAARRVLPRLRRIPFVVEVHGDWHTASRLYGSRARIVLAPLADRLASMALREAELVRVLGPHTRDLVAATGRGGDVQQFVPFAGYSLFLDQPTVPRSAAGPALFIGALERYKGADLLVPAWTAVVARHPHAELLVVGEGALEGEILRAAEAAGLADRIHLLGPRDQIALREVLDRASCLVLPSRAEGLGRVLLEAAARARPVVATAVGGIPELVRDGINGRLVPPDDPAALAHAVSAVFDDPCLADAQGARGRAAVERLDPTRAHEAGLQSLGAWLADR
jgi:glycosyltransferase involved in cell wall biosynthesis